LSGQNVSAARPPRRQVVKNSLAGSEGTAARPEDVLAWVLGLFYCWGESLEQRALGAGQRDSWIRVVTPFRKERALWNPETPVTPSSSLRLWLSRTEVMQQEEHRAHVRCCNGTKPLLQSTSLIKIWIQLWGRRPRWLSGSSSIFFSVFFLLIL